MPTYYLAIDLGASSGRLILGWLENERIRLEEVHRFHNGMVDKDGHKVWEVDRLFREILAGMRRCRDSGRKPSYIGIDTWGVDFVLLDRDDRILGDAVGYRDTRTQGMDEAIFKIVPELDLMPAPASSAGSSTPSTSSTPSRRGSPSSWKKPAPFSCCPNTSGSSSPAKR